MPRCRSILLLLEWRDASGGCAVPVQSGPLHNVLQEMSALGHELVGIDQVWDSLARYLAFHVAPVKADGGL